MPRLGTKCEFNKNNKCQLDIKHCNYSFVGQDNILMNSLIHANIKLFQILYKITLQIRK
jgi:hypothetical protein